MKRLGLLGISALFGASLFALGTGTASADAYDCSVTHPERKSAAAVCTNGTGEYRAYTRCDSRLSVDYDRYGPWVRVGKTSTAVCNVWSGDRAFNSTVQVH
ncbi:hypothetical protein Amsp01_101550 [Amycolatopsis sp. NBRC 101858]|uniref:hypothetical protein n=1 Tax=Amycolatopsis sp. NBRC 101858 TaxID=3032200 RepID=UPI0024A6021B|nr:hypothetical protein [Amycolatopsis sp. NBRC 101858]GLY44132.1 hypothetical protein Amsp01_101550 [Amycolatopsis sp. NBRC 101858]